MIGELLGTGIGFIVVGMWLFVLVTGLFWLVQWLRDL